MNPTTPGHSCQLDALSRKELIAIIFEMRWGIGSREKDPEHLTRRELHDYVQNLIRNQVADE